MTGNPKAAAVVPAFEDGDLLDRLDSLEVGAFERLDFGLVTMDPQGIVIGYNAAESAKSGLSPDRVLGRHFYTEIGPCANNRDVAGRFDTVRRLDDQLDYTFTFRMRVRPVRLRLMAAAGGERRYMAVQERAAQR
jgi:photoactive yellow protein